MTCEHGGNRIPPSYASLFRGQRQLLDSHRGYDPGALGMARALSRALGGVLIASTVSRLLVELNRSPGQQYRHSPIMRNVSHDVCDAVRRRYYEPYRREVEAFVAKAVAAGVRVVHVSSHSFTPSLARELRRADVGLLYDPARTGERDLCVRWQRALEARAPDWLVRRNYPYLGRSDGLTSHLRKRYDNETYAGIELEVNQKHVRNGAFPARDRRVIIAAFFDALATQHAMRDPDAR